MYITCMANSGKTGMAASAEKRWRKIFPTPESRFWCKVLKPIADGCWLWKAYKNPAGYGIFPFMGRQIATHTAWFFTHGKMPSKCLLHKCDNPACVNPDHLFEGTRADNVADAVRKGRNRGLPGMNNHRAKLNNDQVFEIRKLYASGIKPSEISKRMGISLGCAETVAYKKKWKHLD